MTRIEMIRQMSDKELATFIGDLIREGGVTVKGFCNPGGECDCPYASQCNDDDELCGCHAVDEFEDMDIQYWLRREI